MINWKQSYVTIGCIIDHKYTTEFKLYIKKLAQLMWAQSEINPPQLTTGSFTTKNMYDAVISVNKKVEYDFRLKRNNNNTNTHTLIFKTKIETSSPSEAVEEGDDVAVYVEHLVPTQLQDVARAPAPSSTGPRPGPPTGCCSTASDHLEYNNTVNTINHLQILRSKNVWKYNILVNLVLIQNTVSDSKF